MKRSCIVPGCECVSLCIYWVLTFICIENFEFLSVQVLSVAHHSPKAPKRSLQYSSAYRLQFDMYGMCQGQRVCKRTGMSSSQVESMRVCTFKVVIYFIYMAGSDRQASRQMTDSQPIKRQTGFLWIFCWPTGHPLGFVPLE